MHTRTYVAHELYLHRAIDLACVEKIMAHDRFDLHHMPDKFLAYVGVIVLNAATKYLLFKPEALMLRA